MFQYDLENLIGKRPFDHKTNYENYMDSDSTAKEVEAPVVVETIVTETIAPETPSTDSNTEEPKSE